MMVGLEMLLLVLCCEREGLCGVAVVDGEGLRMRLSEKVRVSSSSEQL